MSPKKEEALKLAKILSVDILEEKKSLHDILLACKTICKYLDIAEKNEWIDLELNGYLAKYKTRDQLYHNLPPYRKTSWIFYDLYGNKISLPADIVELFGESSIYQSIHEIETSNSITIRSPFIDKFNEFTAKHGIDYASKNVKIHEARIQNGEIRKILDGVKNRIHELLDNLILILESG